MDKPQIFLAGMIVGLIMGGGLVGYLTNVYGPETEPEATSSTTTDPRAALDRDNLLIRFNEQRLAAGLEQVGVQKELEEAAQKRAESLEQKNQCSHDGINDALKPLQREGYVVSELISCGDKNSTVVIQGFMDSPTHKDGILEPRLYAVGIGIHDDTVIIITRKTK